MLAQVIKQISARSGGAVASPPCKPVASDASGDAADAARRSHKLRNGMANAHVRITALIRPARLLSHSQERFHPLRVLPRVGASRHAAAMKILHPELIVAWFASTVVPMQRPSGEASVALLLSFLALLSFSPMKGLLLQSNRSLLRELKLFFRKCA